MSKFISNNSTYLRIRFRNGSLWFLVQTPYELNLFQIFFQILSPTHENENFVKPILPLYLYYKSILSQDANKYRFINIKLS